MTTTTTIPAGRKSQAHPHPERFHAAHSFSENLFLDPPLFSSKIYMCSIGCILYILNIYSLSGWSIYIKNKLLNKSLYQLCKTHLWRIRAVHQQLTRVCVFQRGIFNKKNVYTSYYSIDQLHILYKNKLLLREYLIIHLGV